MSCGELQAWGCSFPGICGICRNLGAPSGKRGAEGEDVGSLNALEVKVRRTEGKKKKRFCHLKTKMKNAGWCSSKWRHSSGNIWSWRNPWWRETNPGMKLGQSKAERFHQKPVLDQNQVCYNRDVTRKCRNQHPIQICASKDRNFTIACCKQNSIKSVPPKTEKFHQNMLQREFYPNLRFQSHSEHVEEPFNSTKGSTTQGQRSSRIIYSPFLLLHPNPADQFLPSHLLLPQRLKWMLQESLWLVEWHFSFWRRIWEHQRGKSLFFCKDLVVIAADRAPLQLWGLRKSWKPSQSWLTRGIIKESPLHIQPQPQGARGYSQIWDGMGKKWVKSKLFGAGSWNGWRKPEGFFFLIVFWGCQFSHSWQDLGNQIFKFFYRGFQGVCGEGRVIPWESFGTQLLWISLTNWHRERPEKPLGISSITDIREPGLGGKGL